MEELTGYIFRNAVNRHFGHIDKYFTPFLSPDNRIMKTRSAREIIPANNEGLYVVPQLLTNDPPQFNDAAKLICDMGYQEININFGCPSNTVASKFKGSGILRSPELMDRFLDGVFDKKGSALSQYPDLRISVKTRVGYNETSDFEKVLDILDLYPFYEIIIHPRLKKDLYNHKPRMELFRSACAKLTGDIVYNGDIFSAADFNALTELFDDPSDGYAGKVTAAMIGRGAIKDPGIFRQIRTDKAGTKAELFDFLDELYEDYKEVLGTDNAISKMKEVWSYVTLLIPDEKERMRVLKTIVSAKGDARYKDAVIVAKGKIR